MKNKIKKLLFSGILSLVLVFGFAFASLSVLRTNDHANAGSANYTCKGSLGYSYEFPLSYNLSLDASETTIGDLRAQLKNALETDHDYWSVSEIKLYHDHGGVGELNDFDEITTGENSKFVNEKYAQSDTIYFGVYTLSDPDRQFTGNLGDFPYYFDGEVEISFVKGTLSSYLSDDEYDVVVNSISYGGEVLDNSAELGSGGRNTVHPFTYTATKTPKQSSQQEEQQSQKKIEFTTVPYYDENSSTPNYRFASGEGAYDSFLVTNNLPTFYINYNVTYNYGVNSLLLLPTFDTDFFEITNVTVYNDEAGWSEATITKDGFDRILLEGEDLFSDAVAADSTDAPVTLLRIKFATKKLNGITGLHAFGLDLAKNGNDQNTYSQAFKWLDGTKLGEQEEVQVVVNNAADANQVRFFEMQTPMMEIKTTSTSQVLYKESIEAESSNALYYLEFTYTGSPVTTKLNTVATSEGFENAFGGIETANLQVDYLYYGASTLEESNVIVNWYRADEITDTFVKGEQTNSNVAPTNPGWYVVEITVPQTGIFSSITKTGIIHIERATLTITLENKTSAYGTSLATLTYMYGDNRYNSGEAFTAPNSQNITVNISTAATSSSNVGHYEITASVYSPYYNVNINTATYTITARQITVRVEQGTQEVVYSGSEPTIAKDYDVYYAVVGNTITDGDVASALKEGQVVTLELVPYENVSKWNVGFYYIQGKLNNTNYEIAAQTKGTLKITSQNVSFDNCFEGDEVVYDGQEHELLKVVGTIPSYVNYTPQSFKRTNAGDYNFTVTLTLSAQDAANYTNNETSIEVPVAGKILPRDIYVKAKDKSSYFGEPRATLEWVLDNDAAVQDENNNNPGNNIVGTDSLGFTLFVREGQTAVDVPHANAGEYTIDFNLSNANSNYNIHKTTATYTINRIAPQISINAANVNYNRPLSITAKVNNEPYAYVVKKGEVVQDLSTVLDAGEYTVVVSYAQSTNYNALVETQNFTISKVNLKAPTVTYSGKTATWTAVTTDAVENDNKALYNTELTYTVTNGSGTISESTYTAVAADKGQQLTLHVASSNTNYNAVDVNLNAVYEVTFAEGSHEFNTAHATPMPASQLLFAGQKATAPTSNPALDGYTFAGWYLNEAEYGFASVESGVTANIELVAHWNAIPYKVKLSIRRTEDGVVEKTEYEVYYNQELGTTVPNLVETNMILNEYPETLDFTFPSKEAAEADEEYTADDFGKIFRFDTWMIDNEPKTPQEVVATKVTGDINLTIRYKVVGYAEFTVTYKLRTYVSKDNAENTDYTAYATESVHKFEYTKDVDYETLAEKNWFARDTWYLDEERNIPAPATMPNKDITVYGAYVFDIGTGDVNANKEVNTNDIMVYRQLIVGGYDITDVAENGVLAAAESFDNENKYFLRLVADVNGDNSLDIRDVSTIRMTIAGGYGWEDENGYNVSGHEVIRNVKTKIFTEVSTALEAGKKVTLSDDVTSESALEVSYPGHVTLDLGGHTLTVAKVDLRISNRGTLTIKNGTIVTTQGITLRAPYGNVVIDGVTGYDKDGVVNLQAAQNSLHLAGLVRFFEGVDTTVTTTPAAVNVEEGTHVVIEAAAELVVEKLVVTHDVFQTTSTVETLTIALNNYSAAVETVVVENGSVKNDNLIYTYEDLVNAGNRDGLYTLMADIDCGSNDVVYNNVNVVLDLNRHNITFASWGFEANLGASLTINGLGTVTAGKACLYSRRNSELVINGGNYVSNDHYVIGTNGSSNQGVSHIVINGGTFTSYITTANKIPCGIYLANNDTLEVNGGTFNIENGVGILARAGHTTVSDKAVFNVTGNGTFGQAGDSKVNIPSGSVLVLDYAANYPAGDPVITNKSTYKVVAVVESEADLQSAFTVADKVVLLADIELTREIVARKNITLDLNNHKLYNTVTIWENEYYDYALIGVTGCTLTIVGDGQVIAKEDDCYAVETWNNGTVVINGGTYAGNCHAVYVYEGAAVINGGYYYIQQLSSNPDPYGYVLNCYDANYKNGTATIVVTGGQFEKFNPADCAAESPRGHFVPEGYRVVEENGVYTVKLSSLVATAEEFVEFVANGGNVTLENDIDLAAQVEVNKDVVLDLNGHTLRYIGQTTLNSGLLAVRRGAILTINDTVGTGKVDASSNNVYAAVALTLAADGATGEVAKVVVNGGTLEGYYYGVVGNGSRHDTEVVVNDGTLYGINGSGIYNPQDGLVIVNGGNVKGLETAIEIRAGELVINGGEFEALATAYTLTGNGSGTTLTGVIIAVSQHTTLKPITVTINDGTFTNGVCAVALVDTTVNTHSDLINVTINGGTFNSVKSATSRTIYVKNGNLTINGGNYNSGPDNNDEGNSTILVDSYGHVTINGGTFRAGAKWGGRYWTLNKYNNVANTASLLVCGGTYYEFDPSNPNTDDSVTYLAEGYTVTVENEVYTVVEVNN